MIEQLDLIPLKRVGPFIFDSHFDHYSFLNLIEIEEEYLPVVNWNVFTIEKKDIRIYFENNLLVAISCDDECFYNGKNLIGLSFEELKSVLMIEPDAFDEEDLDDGIRQVYNFNSLELVVYVEEDKVISISASGPCLE